MKMTAGHHPRVLLQLMVRLSTSQAASARQGAVRCHSTAHHNTLSLPRSSSYPAAPRHSMVCTWGQHSTTAPYYALLHPTQFCPACRTPPGAAPPAIP